MSNDGIAPGQPRRFGSYLLNFLLWSALFGFVHYAFLPSYVTTVLWLGDALLETASGVAVMLGPAPTDGVYASRGFLLLAEGMAQPFRYPHNLYSVTLNFLFAPALVLTTLGTDARAWVRVALAVLIMLLLHALHVSTIALYFPLTQAPLPNPLIGEDFPGWLAALVRSGYGFVDKMGYTLFPFIAWFCVCFGQLIKWFHGQARRSF